MKDQGLHLAIRFDGRWSVFVGAEDAENFPWSLGGPTGIALHCFSRGGMTDALGEGTDEMTAGECHYPVRERGQVRKPSSGFPAAKMQLCTHAKPRDTCTY